MNKSLLTLMALLSPFVAVAADYYLQWSNNQSPQPVKFEHIGHFDSNNESYDEYVAELGYDVNKGGLGLLTISDSQQQSESTRYWGAYVESNGNEWYLADRVEYPVVIGDSADSFLSTWTGDTNGGDFRQIKTQAPGKEGQYLYGKTYKFYLKDFGDNNMRIQTEEVLSYYFYSDMNRWSSLDLGGGPVRIYTENLAIDLTSTIWRPGEEPNYYSPEELKRDWQFVRCSVSELPAGIADIPGEWYKLDMTRLSDLNGNVGRLCGQFKITCGNRSGSDNFGMFNGYDNVSNLLDKGIEANKLFTDVANAEGLQNFHLAANFMENAVIYFNPRYGRQTVTDVDDKRGQVTYLRSGALYIDVPQPEENVKNLYVYYAVYGADDFGAPVSANISDLSQINYYTNANGFNSSGASEFNPDGTLFYWEKWDNDGQGVEYQGYTYPYVYRRLIPYGATHRFPVPFNVSLTGYTGTKFPSQQIDCDDMWFIEGEVNVHFRYADGHQPTWVAYNAFCNTFDPQYGTINGQRYAYGTIVNHWQRTDLTLAQGPEDDKEYWYYSSRKSLPLEFSSGSYVIFQTSEGAVYPVDGVSASSVDLKAAAINGHDLYYVVPTPDPEIHILYTHLNGSYRLGSEHATQSFQIEAEFFDSDGQLDTHYDDESIKYSFNVSHRDADGNIVYDLSATDYSNAPYTDQWQPSAAGVYNVVVRVLKDGRVYTASDIYPVFPALDNDKN